ncbi:AMP-binding protein [Planctomicrobium sp. SH527]|uniref:AMP-binding protein n=1 Tax=Planctomicrobium sp. SH527 TaxID=3448123 RepID=UPI003F5C5644
MSEVSIKSWVPTEDVLAKSNIAWLMQHTGIQSPEALHQWSVSNRDAYWATAVGRLGVRFREPYQSVLDISDGVENAHWFTGSRLNIVESCFTAPLDSPAIIHQSEDGSLQTMTVGELAELSDQVAANIVRIGIETGSAIAILMPMTAESVAIYLGIIKAGCVVVGIADSFQPKEIASRIRLSNAVAIFTQDVLVRNGKVLPLFENVVQANGPRAIVLPAVGESRALLRAGDEDWRTFLQDQGPFEAVVCDPEAPTNILFSSGTTGDPKVIPWTHITPIKCAADAHFHQNVHQGDVVAWPTNLGWMMGPWLIYGSLMNQATIALYNGAPTGRGFGKFIEAAKVNVLGVIPSLVGTWRSTNSMDALDWSSIHAISSTGECSRPEDMAWLMEFAGNCPIIEYCGGTELAGAYIGSTVARPCIPGQFNTPILGMDMVILDEEGQPSDQGELFLVPPSIGMSTRLLNRDHHEIYYEGTPAGPNGEKLRRHGDQMLKLPDVFWKAQGRADDTMNLGGIKVSSAEIEQALHSVPELKESAAIAVSISDGPSQLVIYAVKTPQCDKVDSDLIKSMQTSIRTDLNPLFKIHDVIFVDALPRTASNKVMRRTLRDWYHSAT